MGLQLYSKRKDAQYPFDRRLVGPQSLSECGGKGKKIPAPARVLHYFTIRL
jgi:hypothetical protein